MFRMYGLCFVLLMGSFGKSMGSEYSEIWPNIPDKLVQGVTYEKLQEVFQNYPVNRAHTDQGFHFIQKCKDLSGWNRETRHVIENGPPIEYTKYVAKSKPCKSILQNCQGYDVMKDPVQFCVSAKKDRRFEYMQVLEKDIAYGYYPNNNCTSFEYYHNDLPYWPCVCDCESSENEADRYFSLQDVVSDEDKVVTGVRIKKDNHVFHIQIQQGTLGPQGKIVGEAKWKELKSIATSDLLSKNVSEYQQKTNEDDLLKFKKNNLVYAVTFEQKTVYLDDLKAGPNKVVTGLRFQQVGQDLRLEIQVTPFDYKSGTLIRGLAEWSYNSADRRNRHPVKFSTLGVPSENNERTEAIVSESGLYIQFQTSDFKLDLGQTTVPFIDLQDVIAHPPSPLFGAGLFHKATYNSAGFIAFRGFYDLSSK